jgi:ABC-2 type transport system permease protein
MSNIWIICRKELKSYFASPVAYVLLALFAVIIGYFFYAATTYTVVRGMEAQMMGRGMPININEWIVSPVLMNASVIGLFLIPMLTMRLFAEEKRSGTIELLTTSPVSDAQIILGKWLAAFLMFAALLLVSAANLTILFIYGQPDWRPILVAYLGLLLQGGALLAIGTFISTLTKNQIIAAAGAFVVCLLLWVLSWTSEFDSTATSKVISYLSVVSHFEPFSRGVLDLKDVLFYVSVIFFGLFLTARSMESLRWRS